MDEDVPYWRLYASWARLGWSGTSGPRQNRGTSTHKGPSGPLMCACAPVSPQTGGPGPAQTTPVTHISAKRAHRQGRQGASREPLVAILRDRGRPVGVAEARASAALTALGGMSGIVNVLEPQRSGNGSTTKWFYRSGAGGS